MSYLYNTFLYQPLLNALVLLYNTVAFHDLGVSIILLTIIIRLVLFPLFHKSAQHQMVMQRIQPKLKKIQEEHKGNREKQAEAMMALYREHNINPLSGIFLLIIQLPVLIALYHLFSQTLAADFLSKGLYSFIHPVEEITPTLLGLINLKEKSIFMVGLAALAQYIQARLAQPKPVAGETLSDAEKIGRMMVFIGPLLTLLIFWGFPAAVSLYWAVTSVFSVVQQIIIRKQTK